MYVCMYACMYVCMYVYIYIQRERRERESETWGLLCAIKKENPSEVSYVSLDVLALTIYNTFLDLYTEALGKRYHPNHFTCVKCNMAIEEFTIVDGKPYCTEDYNHLFLDKCAGCGQVLASGETTGNARHLNHSLYVYVKNN